MLDDVLKIKAAGKLMMVEAHILCLNIFIQSNWTFESVSPFPISLFSFRFLQDQGRQDLNSSSLGSIRSRHTHIATF